MTDEQYAAIQLLTRCTFLPGSYEKRFVGDMSLKLKTDELTERQSAFLARVAYRYRGQIHSLNPSFDLEWTLDSPDVQAMVTRRLEKRSKR
jgi:hypothetical protein